MGFTSPFLAFALLLLVVAAILLGLHWLFIDTEGLFLGERVVLWLYSLTAHRYDAIKQFDPAAEFFLVTEPILQAIAGTPAPLILDVATGTGRVPYNLFQQPNFDGFVVGLDGSKGMLHHAQLKLAPYPNRYALVQQKAAPLPFLDNCFDLVCCLEALEFFPSDENALREMGRVLRPGGTLLVTRRKGWDGRLFLHRYRSAQQFVHLLENVGVTAVSCRLWQISYDLYIAVKPV